MARRGSLRASDADRESVVERLRSAAAEGRLAAHELEHRVGAALGARTYGELDATVADLPSASLQRRTGAGTVATLREHPLLLVALIPVVLFAVALFAAITIASLAVAGVLFILGRRRGVYFGPRGVCVWRHGFRSYTSSGARRREPGHWGYWA
jgi:hypothetical protein